MMIDERGFSVVSSATGSLVDSWGFGDEILKIDKRDAF